MTVHRERMERGTRQTAETTRLCQRRKATGLSSKVSRISRCPVMVTRMVAAYNFMKPARSQASHKGIRRLFFKVKRERIPIPEASRYPSLSRRRIAPQ